MVELKSGQELRAVIRVVARELMPGTTSQQAAEDLYESARGLIAEFADLWIVEKLASLIRAERAKLRKPSAERRLGFGRMPRRIVLKSGKDIPRGKATLWDYRLFRRQIVKDKAPLVAEVERRIALMEPYSAEQRNITWENVIEKELERRGL